MSRPAQPIRDYFRTPDRFLRSTQLERDFHDPHALAGYILTPSMAQAFRRLADALRPNSGRRAWRITGDYGVGKSSFALVLAHLLADPKAPVVSSIAESLAWPHEVRLWPLLVTGTRDDLVSCVARGVADSLAWRSSVRSKEAGPLRKTALKLAKESGTAAELETLLAEVQEVAARDGAGVLLVIDELGKLLEHAAANPDTSDVFVLQRLAESAMRSGAKPFLMLGLLHQGFHAYVERLPATSRHEWDKVAGRFDEIVFDQPLAHVAALVAGTLGIRPERIPKSIEEAARKAAKATASTGWLAGGASGMRMLDSSSHYPIHPTLLAPLVRFFARYGQHERSLFGFLLSDEPFALRAFAEQPAAPTIWYGLPEFYDYVRSSFGHRLSGRSQETHWLKISATVDTADGLTEVERRTLKAVGLLNLLDAEDLLATDRALSACFSPQAEDVTEDAIKALVDRGLLFRRGDQGGYRLWPNTSVNLRAAFDRASQEISALNGVADHLGPYLDTTPLVARRHYIERGTLRYFEIRYASADALGAALDRPSQADGLVIIALTDRADERAAVQMAALEPPFSDRPDVVLGIGEPLATLAGDLVDLKRWEWVQAHTPELSHDAYAAAEVGRTIAHLRRELTAKIALRTGFAAQVKRVAWFRLGEPLPTPKGLIPALSVICDERFYNAPQITNELLNRNVLSSPAAAARMRLIEGLVLTSDQPDFGFDRKKAPPERSMYLSVMQRGLLHVETPDGWRLTEPPPEDPLHLRPVFVELMRAIEGAGGAPVPITDLLARLKEPPYGVRDGIAPLLIAIVLKLHAHELALYEDGTFVPRWSGGEFMRMLKQPASFAVQACLIEGVREEVFAKLAEVFSKDVRDREAQLLDVVTPLCQFAANLEEYVRKAGALSPAAAAVRDALLNAREPATLIFQDLPMACGVSAFTANDASDSERTAEFVQLLQDAIDELRTAYSRLRIRLIGHIVTALKAPEFDRAKIAARAARVSLAAREPRLRTFALRLRDPHLDDEAWLEALGAYVLSRPPKRWGPGDELQFSVIVGELAEVFHRVEATAFNGEEVQPDQDAIRLNLTRADGVDRLHVLHPVALDKHKRQALDSLRGQLPQDPALRLQYLSALLWDELEGRSKAKEQEVDDQPESRARTP